MRILVRLFFVACFLATGARAYADQCDVMVLNGSWSEHADPDSIILNYYPDVTSDQVQNPRQYDMLLNVKFDGVLEDQHQLHLEWSQSFNCGGSCPPDVCEEKIWTFKGATWTDRSYCTRNFQGVCGCPSLGTPVMHRKVVRKPPAPVMIEVEIVPLELQGCPLTNSENDRTFIPYPGSGPVPGSPGASPGGVLALAMGLVGLSVLTLRLRRRAA